MGLGVRTRQALPYCTPPMDQRDVDLEFCKVWASNFPKDYRANYRKGLA